MERFFTREIRESRVEEFIKLRRGGTSVKEYSLKYVNLSKYASSLVQNSMAEMSRFVTVVSEDLVEDCWAAMLHENMDLGRLMANAKQVEKIHRKRRFHEGKKPKTAHHTFSTLCRGLFRVQNRPKFKSHSRNSASS